MVRGNQPRISRSTTRRDRFALAGTFHSDIAGVAALNFGAIAEVTTPDNCK
jgi:hypothetical protein